MPDCGSRSLPKASLLEVVSPKHYTIRRSMQIHVPPNHHPQHCMQIPNCSQGLPPLHLETKDMKLLLDQLGKQRGGRMASCADSAPRVARLALSAKAMEHRVSCARYAIVLLNHCKKTQIGTCKGAVLGMTPLRADTNTEQDSATSLAQ